MTISYGLENVVVAETDLSLVDGKNGLLVYRGQWARDLAVNKSFEEVAYLLWYGHLPTPLELDDFKRQLIDERAIPEAVKGMIVSLPDDADMMDILRTAVSSLGGNSYSWPPTFEQALRITAKIPTIIAYRYNHIKGNEQRESRVDLDHTANYLYMLKGTEPSPAHVRALDAYLILTQEHGMNASTFAGRVVASTRSDLVSSIVAAIGALKGPLHGGAPSAVTDMLESIGTKAAAGSWIRSQLEKGERLMGFGHRVYRTLDPRAVALRQVASALAENDPWFDLATHVENVALKILEEYKPGRGLNTNVEFYAAAVMRAIGLEADLFTPTFAMSRTVGWSAHIIEAAQHRIIRPESNYKGEMPV